MANVRMLRPKGATNVSVQLRSNLHVRAEFIEPKEHFELRLAELWREILNVDHVGTQDDYFDLGGDSLMAAELFLQLEQWNGVQLAMSEILEHSTVEKLAVLVRDQARPEPDSCLLHLQLEGANPPLFVVHDMSGGVMSYRHCLRRLGNRRKIFGLLYPGHLASVTSVMSLPELGAKFAEVMRQAYPKGPYYLAGFSLGGQIAYATACHLRATGSEVGLLALIDGGTRRGSVTGLRREARKLARRFFRLADVEVRHWPGYLIRSTSRELRRIWKKDRGKQPSKPVFAGLLAQQWGLYSPPTYAGAVKLLRSTDDSGYFNKRYLGWDEYVTGPLEVFDISSNHENIMAEPRAALVTAFLENWMREADQVGPS